MPLRSVVRRAVRKVWHDKRHARYHFIHIPKNAGEAVRDALYFQRDVSLSTPFHYRYVDIADSVGRDLRFFAIVRNPWSRTASRYQFARQMRGKLARRATRGASSSPTQHLTISCANRKILPIPEHPGQPWMGPLSSWFNQLEWIRDERGSVVCDCLRMEKLDDDLPAYLDRTTQAESAERDPVTVRLSLDVHATSLPGSSNDCSAKTSTISASLSTGRPPEIRSPAVECFHRSSLRNASKRRCRVPAASAPRSSRASSARRASRWRTPRLRSRLPRFWRRRSARPDMAFFPSCFALVAFLTIPSELGIPGLAVREIAVTNARKDWDHMRGFIVWSHRAGCHDQRLR